ncbi:hypothetical protein LSAT2_005283, partial [Lamellibrachia satsuma]
PYRRPVPRSPAVHCPFCTIASSSEDIFLEHFLTEHRNLCRKADTDDADGGGRSSSPLQPLLPAMETPETDMTDTKV